MPYKYFSHNGKLAPVDKAVVPLSRLEYSYGFGVYETIRVVGGMAFFLDEHCQRLLQSAKIIDLDHSFSASFIKTSALQLMAKNTLQAANLKILLIGGPTKETASFEILCLNPLFPDKQLYKSGASCLTCHYERDFPGAKTLSMLPSYLAFRQARAAGAYDALFVNRHGCLTEGTRTNFFGLKDRVIVSPPVDQILPGITLTKVLAVATQHKFEVSERDIKLDEIQDFDNFFLTSTSSKILPIKAIDDYRFTPLSPALKELMLVFNQYLDSYLASGRA